MENPFINEWDVCLFWVFFFMLCPLWITCNLPSIVISKISLSISAPKWIVSLELFIFIDADFNRLFVKTN